MPPADDIDALFQLPPDKFTAARNELAARLKAAGKDDEAARVKGLAKPPVSAWVVNQLFWKKRKSFDRLMTTGERLRTAQASQLRGKGGELREPLEARRVALGELSKEAAALLREVGHNPSPDLMRRVTTTLEALATYANHPSAPQAGRLTGDIDAPGFEALSMLIPRGPASASAKATADRKAGPQDPPKILQFARKPPPARSKDPKERKKQEEAERKARIAEATAAIQAAEKSLADAKKAAARAEAALRKAAARAKEAERAKEEISARYEKLTAAADEARLAARKVAAEAEDAAQAVEDAERALADARRTKAALASGG
jgi:hypothetical protein